MKPRRRRLYCRVLHKLTVIAKLSKWGGGDASPFDNSTEDVSGAHPRGAMGPAPPPLRPKNTRFSWFLPLNYVICSFEERVRKFLLCGRSEETFSMVKSLRKVYFSQPTDQYIGRTIPARDSLETILGAPLGDVPTDILTIRCLFLDKLKFSFPTSCKLSD